MPSPAQYGLLPRRAPIPSTCRYSGRRPPTRIGTAYSGTLSAVASRTPPFRLKWPGRPPTLADGRRQLRLSMAALARSRLSTAPGVIQPCRRAWSRKHRLAAVAGLPSIIVVIISRPPSWV